MGNINPSVTNNIISFADALNKYYSESTPESRAENPYSHSHNSSHGVTRITEEDLDKELIEVLLKQQDQIKELQLYIDKILASNMDISIYSKHANTNNKSIYVIYSIFILVTLYIVL